MTNKSRRIKKELQSLDIQEYGIKDPPKQDKALHKVERDLGVGRDKKNKTKTNKKLSALYIDGL